jgi:hypothetical protein
MIKLKDLLKLKEAQETEKPESRKARIVRDLVKDKKKNQEETSDKYQKDPEISSEIQKN